jgi:hypothetical protein
MYMGAKAGIMRQTSNGNIMTMTMTNLDFEADIKESDFELVLPEGVVEMDLTPMTSGMFGDIAE